MAQIRPVMLAGGSGSRLWPLSRANLPKQLLAVTSEQTMLQETALRLTGPDFLAPVVVGGEAHRFLIKRQLEAIGVIPAAIVLEPVGRNTAAAAALAASWASQDDEDPLLLLLPADHLIKDRAAFLAAVQAGIPAAMAGDIVTFGAQPSGPSTQYGYIEAALGAPAQGPALPVRRFAEKPDRATAERYLSEGNFFWNAGIFLFLASTLRRELDEQLPETLRNTDEAMASAVADGNFLRPDATAFARTPNISIDYGIMEGTSRASVVPVDMGWSDIGSWDAVWAQGQHDPQGNATTGDVLALDTKNSLIRSDSGVTIATIGLDGMAVIAVRDAIFVAPRHRTDEVRSLVERMAAEGRDLGTMPARVERPWGSYESKDSGKRYQVKHILVAPGETLSLQMHHHRSEHWVVVSGSAEVTVDGKVSLLQENQSTYIPAGSTHRLANPGRIPLELVEVQCGPYLGEDDIVRFDDEYGRA